MDEIFAVGYGNKHPEHFKLIWSDYSPTKILIKFGVPSRVLLRAPRVTGLGNTGKTGYILWLIYDQLSFKIRYDGEVNDLPVYHFCSTLEAWGSQIDQISIRMQSPDNSRPLDKNYAILGDERWKDTVKTIEEASGINNNEFYTLMFQTEKQSCFDSLHNIWPIR